MWLDTTHHMTNIDPTQPAIVMQNRPNYKWRHDTSTWREVQKLKGTEWHGRTLMFHDVLTSDTQTQRHRVTWAHVDVSQRVNVRHSNIDNMTLVVHVLSDQLESRPNSQHWHTRPDPTRPMDGPGRPTSIFGLLIAVTFSCFKCLSTSDCRSVSVLILWRPLLSYGYSARLG